MKRMDAGKLSYNRELQFDECYAARVKGQEEKGINKGKGSSFFFAFAFCYTHLYNKMSEKRNINTHVLCSILKLFVDRKEIG